MGTAKGSSELLSTLTWTAFQRSPLRSNEGPWLGNRFVTIHVEIALLSGWIAVVPEYYLLGAPHASLLLLARNGHSLLASTQKVDRPTAMTLFVRSSNTTYSPGDNASSSLMRLFADARSFTASNRQKLTAMALV